jgi:hypothetical protein
MVDNNASINGLFVLILENNDILMVSLNVLNMASIVKPEILFYFIIIQNNVYTGLQLYNSLSGRGVVEDEVTDTEYVTLVKYSSPHFTPLHS